MFYLSDFTLSAVDGRIEHTLQVGDEIFCIFYDVLQPVLAERYVGFNLLDLLSVFLDIKEGDSPDWDLQESLYIVVVRENTFDFIQEGLEACYDSLFHAFCRLFVFNLFIDSLLNEDPFQRPCPEFVFQVAHFNVELFSESIHQMVCMELDLFTYSYDFRQTIHYHQRIHAYFLLAICRSVEYIHHIFGVHSSLPTYFDIGLFRSVVIDGGYLQLPSGISLLYRLYERGGSDFIWKFLYYKFLWIRCVELGPDGHLSPSVVVVGDIHCASCREVGIYFKILTSQGLLLALQYFKYVMGEDFGGHTYGDAAGSCNGNYRYLCLEYYRLFVSSVIGVYIFGDLGRIQYFLCKGFETTLYVSGGSGTISGEDVSIVTLAFDEEAVVLNVYKGTIYRGVSMRMVLHGLSHHSSHLIESSIVDGDHCMENSPLYRLEAVQQVWNGPVPDYI